MRTRRFMALISSIVLAALAAVTLAPSASAAGETATLGIKLDPRGSTFFKEAFRPGNLSITTQIGVPPGSPTIEPMKQANLQLPGFRTLGFTPKSNMPVCPDSKVNATTVSVPVETIIKACPRSIIGNGTATFALAQSTALPRDGVIIVFNGGKQRTGPLRGQPRVKLYAYSYDTEVGLYTEAALARDGSLDFSIPPLSADSSVTSINLNIPGVPTSVNFPLKGVTANLPAGQDPSYIQAKCPGNGFGAGALFLLGKRPEGGVPGPTTTLNASASYACTGAIGSPRLRNMRVYGSHRLKARQSRVYRVRVRNYGTRTARAMKILVRGKWVRARNQRVPGLAPGQARTYYVRAGLTRRARKGRVTVISFRTTASRTRATVGKIRVRVR